MDNDTVSKFVAKVAQLFFPYGMNNETVKGFKAAWINEKPEILEAAINRAYENDSRFANRQVNVTPAFFEGYLSEMRKNNRSAVWHNGGDDFEITESDRKFNLLMLSVLKIAMASSGVITETVVARIVKEWRSKSDDTMNPKKFLKILKEFKEELALRVESKIFEEDEIPF